MTSSDLSNVVHLSPWYPDTAFQVFPPKGKVFFVHSSWAWKTLLPIVILKMKKNMLSGKFLGEICQCVIGMLVFLHSHISATYWTFVTAIFFFHYVSVPNIEHRGITQSGQWSTDLTDKRVYLFLYLVRGHVVGSIGYKIYLILYSVDYWPVGCL